MRNEERTEEGEGAAPAADNLARPGGVFKQPGILAGGTALLGLIVGVFLGRATVDEREDGASRVERALVASPRDKAEPEVERQDVVEEPPDAYRVRFTRLPKGASSGLSIDDTTDRGMALVTGKDARLRFEVVPEAVDYALTAILKIKNDATGGNASTGNVKASIDGRALGTWAVRGEWALYTFAVGRLSEGPHELSFAVSDLPASAAVGIDSVAVAPVADELDLRMGPGAAGHLVDGFSKFEGKTAWSLGSKSSVAAVLAPKGEPYQLRVRAYALPKLAPLRVQAKVNGTDIGAAEFESKSRESKWNVPAGLLRAGSNEIELSYSKTARPVDYNPKSKDKRALALRYSRIALLPQQ